MFCSKYLDTFTLLTKRGLIKSLHTNNRRYGGYLRTECAVVHVQNPSIQCSSEVLSQVV